MSFAVQGILRSDLHKLTRARKKPKRQHLDKYVPTFVSCITHAPPGSNARAFCARIMHKAKQGKPGKDSHSMAEFSVEQG